MGRSVPVRRSVLAIRRRWARLRRSGRIDGRAVAVGGRWVRTMVSPTIAVDRPGGAAPDVLVVGSTHETQVIADRRPPVPAVPAVPTVVVAPERGPALVQDRLSNPHRRWVQGGAPGSVRRAALDACRAVPALPALHEPDAVWATWNHTVRARHLGYRTAMNSTVERAIRRARSLDEEPLVTVLCASKRPGELERIVTNYEVQTWPHRELLVVAHDWSPTELAAAEHRLGLVAGARLLRAGPADTLGGCLNLGLAASRAPFFAKFDDDDDYGPAYLGDAMMVHRWADAAVVGKHSVFVALHAADRLLLRFPGREFRYTSYVAGGTLVVDRRQVPDVRFPEISVGEDGEYLRRCERAGGSVFAADQFNYVLHRTGNNTWTIADDELAAGAAPIGAVADTDSAFV